MTPEEMVEEIHRLRGEHDCRAEQTAMAHARERVSTTEEASGETSQMSGGRAPLPGLLETFDVGRGYDGRPQLMDALQMHSSQTGQKIRCMTKEDGHAPSGTKSFWVCCDSRPKGLVQHPACAVLAKCYRQQHTGKWLISLKSKQGAPVFTHNPRCTSTVKLNSRQAAAHPGVVAEQAKSTTRLTLKNVQTVLSQVVGQEPGRTQAAQRDFAFRVARAVEKPSNPADSSFSKAATLVYQFREENPGSVVHVTVDADSVVTEIFWSLGEGLLPILHNCCLHVFFVDGAVTSPACGHQTNMMEMVGITATHHNFTVAQGMSRTEKGLSYINFFQRFQSAKGMKAATDDFAILIDRHGGLIVAVVHCFGEDHVFYCWRSGASGASTCGRLRESSGTSARMRTSSSFSSTPSTRSTPTKASSGALLTLTSWRSLRGCTKWRATKPMSAQACVAPEEHVSPEARTTPPATTPRRSPFPPPHRKPLTAGP
mmetsp:Transcript_55141/g.130459  ORF Transcript_55141/g.130459 Transcript_55141/m.130459 type:complete len:484 (-) Transcript_55141:512-1963(-)